MVWRNRTFDWIGRLTRSLDRTVTSQLEGPSRNGENEAPRHCRSGVSSQRSPKNAASATPAAIFDVVG